MKEYDFLGNPICGNAPSTALHIADYYSHQENIKIIMDRLNDCSPVGGFSRTPLFYVLNGLEEIYEERYKLQMGHLQAVKYMTENTKNILSMAVNKIPADANGDTPLHTSYIHEKPSMPNSLLKILTIRILPIKWAGHPYMKLSISPLIPS